MKTLLVLSLILTSFFASGQNCNCVSVCYCDTLALRWMNNWNKWISNSDSIQLISVKEIGLIQTEENKKKYIELLTADTAWVAHPAMGKKVFIDLLRYDSVQGKDINFFYSDRKMSKTYRSFQRKEYAVSYFNTYVLLTDKYYEIEFEVNGKRIITPAICTAEKYFCRDFLNNILSEISIHRN